MAAATPTSASELLDLLRQSGIWSEADLESRLAAVGPVPADASQAAGFLVEKGLLTGFQARILAGGKYRGFRLGAYVIRDQIGRGGMGAVYLAHHEALRRPVAIKVLTPADKAAATRLNVGRFLREARSAAALDHPNIVRIFDVAQLGEVHYLVMEYVEGQTLEQLVAAGGPLPCGRAVEYVLQAAAGLEHAYQKGFVHRDIKPANLILAKDGTLKILDMGLARSEDTGDQVTEAFDKGAVVGTADYISPEQAMNAPDLDIRADIYSLGATFHTLVTGRPPFAGNTTQKLMQHQIKEAPSLAALDKTFPPELAAVVSKMMRKRPAERYQTPGEVMAALGPWLSNTSHVVAALSRVESRSSPDLQQTLNEVVTGSTKRLPALPAETPARRSALPYVVGAVAAAALCAVAAGGLALYAFSRPSDAVAARDPVKPQAPPPTPPTPAAPTGAAPPVAPPADRASVYSFRAAPLANFREEWRTDANAAKPSQLDESIVATDGDGKLPEGWQRMNYKPGTVSALFVGTSGGVKALGLSTLSGESSTMLFTPRFDSTAPGLRVRVEYRTDGSVGEGTLKFRQTDPPTADYGWDVCKLPATGGAWRVRELALDSRAATRGQIEFHTGWLEVGKTLWVKSLDVTAGDAPIAGGPAASALPAGSKVLYRTKFDELEPFAETSTTVENDQKHKVSKVSRRTGAGKPPADWQLLSWNPETVQEVTAGEWKGVKALSLRTAVGEATTMLFGPEVLFGGAQTRVRIEYAIRGTAGTSAVKLMQRTPDPLDAREVERLPATSGAWQTADFELDVRTAASGHLEIHTSGLPVGESVWIKSITIYQPAN